MKVIKSVFVIGFSIVVIFGGAGCSRCFAIHDLSQQFEEAEILREQWSSEYAWANIADANPLIANGTIQIFNYDEKFWPIVNESDSNFLKAITELSTSDIHSDAAGKLFLSMRASIAQALRAENHLAKNAEPALVLLGDLTGPDGQPLASSSRTAAEIKVFMDELLAREGLEQRWAFVSRDALRMDGNKYIYRLENIFVLDLNITALPVPAQHKIRYKAHGSIAMPATRIASGLSIEQIDYYYQPFMKDWIDQHEEMKRREQEAIQYKLKQG